MDEIEALSIVFGNTKRKKRKENLLTVAEAFAFLETKYHSQEAVAKETGLSREMVREFLNILKLPDEVKSLIKERKIDRIDIAYRLSKIKDKQQLEKIVNSFLNLQTHDLRDIICTVKENDTLTIESAHKVVMKTKPRKLHIFILDFSESEYKNLVNSAIKEELSPAEYVTKIVTAHLSSKNGAKA